MDPMELREKRTAARGPGVVSTDDPDATPAAATMTSSRAGYYPLAYRAVSAIWLVVGAAITVLAFDFGFRLANANDVGFASFIYAVGGALAAPFDGIFGITRTVGTGSIVRWSDLIAVVVYALAGYAIVRVVRIARAPGDGTGL